VERRRRFVPCAITVRAAEEHQKAAEPAPLWQPSFPSPELVHHAADLIPHISADLVGEDSLLTEGPRWEIVVSPGVFRVRTRDYARAERTHERAVARHRKDVDVAANCNGDVPDALPTRGTITAWTRRSRARLVERLSDHDYTKLYGRFRPAAGAEAGLLPRFGLVVRPQAFRKADLATGAAPPLPSPGDRSVLAALSN
jgi:hypothetical protein